MSELSDARDDAVQDVERGALTRLLSPAELKVLGLLDERGGPVRITNRQTRPEVPCVNVAVARALERRGLVAIAGEPRDRWATLSDDGREYVSRGES